MNPTAAKNKLIKALDGAKRYISLARVELLVVIGVLFIDLFTKFLAVRLIAAEYESVQVIPNFLYFTLIFNTKAAFGSAFGLENILGDAGVRAVFLVVTTIATAAFCVFLYVFRKGHILSRLALALIIGGALGNFYDRLFLGKVRDFVEIVWFGTDFMGGSFAVFNMADSALVIGVIIFAVYFIFMYKPNALFVGPRLPADAQAASGSAAQADTGTDAAQAQAKTDTDAAQAGTDTDAAQAAKNGSENTARGSGGDG
ncbi:MAG: signal peptidase II [Clostridiales bacterium]|jgi:signal peptidase II|nr:signal peptidase II [Clostridiales bacterium]